MKNCFSLSVNLKKGIKRTFLKMKIKFIFKNYRWNGGTNFYRNYAIIMLYHRHRYIRRRNKEISSKMLSITGDIY